MLYPPPGHLKLLPKLNQNMCRVLNTDCFLASHYAMNIFFFQKSNSFMEKKNNRLNFFFIDGTSLNK